MEKTKTTDCVLFAFDEREAQKTLLKVLQNLILRPDELLLRRWNWKASLFSSFVRGALFVATNAAGGWHAAISAGATEFLYRAVMAGFYGAVTQSFRRVEPHWQAMLSVMVLLPLLTHGLEFLLHWWRGTSNLAVSIAASMCLTLLSTTFNLYAMRRGALVVGDGGASFASDLRGLPGLIAGYLMAGPIALWRFFSYRSQQTL